MTNTKTLYFVLATIGLVYALCILVHSFEGFSPQVDADLKDMTPKKLLLLYRGKAEDLLSGLSAVGISTDVSMDPKRYPEIATLLKRKGLLPSA